MIPMIFNMATHFKTFPLSQRLYVECLLSFHIMQA